MAKSLNKTLLMGYVGKDPEFKTTRGGTPVVSFSLATTERYKDNGEWKEQTDWHNIVALNRLAEIVRDYVHKGSFLFVEGKNRTRSWDDKQTNKKLYRHEVLIWELSLLDRAEQNGNGGRNRGETADRGDAHEYAGARQNDGYDALGIDDTDIPF